MPSRPAGFLRWGDLTGRTESTRLAAIRLVAAAAGSAMGPAARRRCRRIRKQSRSANCRRSGHWGLRILAWQELDRLEMQMSWPQRCIHANAEKSSAASPSRMTSGKRTASGVVGRSHILPAVWPVGHVSICPAQDPLCRSPFAPAIRFFRTRDGSSNYTVLDLQGDLHVIRPPSPWLVTANLLGGE